MLLDNKTEKRKLRTKHKELAGMWKTLLESESDSENQYKEEEEDIEEDDLVDDEMVVDDEDEILDSLVEEEEDWLIPWH